MLKVWQEIKSMKDHVPGLSQFADLSQMKLVMLTSFGFTGIQVFLDQYVFNHSGWVEIIAIAVVVDTVSGVAKSWKNKTFSSYKFGGVFVKVCLYALFVLVLGGLYNVQSDITQAFATLGYSVIVFREVLSFVENAEVLRPGTFPKWFVKRLEKYDEDGNFVDNGIGGNSQSEKTN